MLTHKRHLERKIQTSIMILLTVFLVVVLVDCANGAEYSTYYATDYEILDGAYLSGSVQTSLQNVDSDYFVVGSSASATSVSLHDPSTYSLFGQTAYVSGVTGDLVSDNGVHMAYRSYPTETSAKTLYAHQEATTIGGSSYYTTKPEGVDLTGITLFASMDTTGRQLVGRFVHPLIGMSSIPASTWTEFYRTWRTSDPIISYDSYGSGNNADGTASIIWSHVVGSAANRLIMVGISIRTVTVSVLNVTVGMQLATFLRSDIRGTEVTGEIWYLVNPDPGPKTVTVTLSGISKASGGSVSYTGVAQTSPIDNHRGLSYGGETPSISLTTTTDNDWIFSNLAISGTATAVVHGNGQTHRYYDIGTGGGGTSRAGSDGDDEPTTTAGSYVMSWNMSWYSDVIAQSVAVKPAPSPAGHIDIDVSILESDGTIRTAIANNVADSAGLTASPATLSGTYSWATYAIVDQTDYLEIDYYVEVTAATLGMVAFLRIDDNALPLSEQTRMANVMLPDEYTAEVELTGTSNTYSWTELEWAVDSSWTVGAVAVAMQLYNHNIGGYPTGGNGFISYTTNATANTDETKAQTITTDPQQFRDAAGNWKIKVKGVKTTNTPFDFKADLMEIRAVYLSEHTVASEFLFSSMTTNSPTQLSFTVVSEYDVADVSITIQVWNFSSSTYTSSGQGYLRYVSSGANDTRTLSISNNPRLCVSNGTARIKIIGTSQTTIQYRQKINRIALVYVSSGSFNWLTAFMYILPVPFAVLFLWFLGLRRKKKTLKAGFGRRQTCSLSSLE